MNGILPGLAIAIVLSLLRFIWGASYLSVTRLRPVPGKGNTYGNSCSLPTPFGSATKFGLCYPGATRSKRFLSIFTLTSELICSANRISVLVFLASATNPNSTSVDERGWKWAKWPSGDVGWLPSDVKMPPCLRVPARNDIQ
jgi:hypothetical protein